MALKDEIEIKYQTYWCNEKAARFNIPIVDLCRCLNVSGLALFDALKNVGIEIKTPLMLGSEDVEWYRNHSKRFEELGLKSYMCELTPDEGAELDLMRDDFNLLNNCVYYDTKFQDPETELWGLRDSNGVVVVPPLFDDCKPYSGADYLDTLSIVKKGEKWWLTPRDGAGKIKKSLCFDSISCSFCFAWVERDGKVGLLDSRTGKDIIPCKMDWMCGNNIPLLCANGKLGWAYTFFSDDCNVISPRFDAIDLTTRRYFKDGKWGWLLRNGHFTTKAPLSSDNCWEIMWNLNSYLGEKPRYDDDKEYYTEEEVFAELDAQIEDIMNERLQPLSYFTHIPQPDFNGIKVPEFINLQSAVKGLSDSGKSSTIKIVAQYQPDAPIVIVEVSDNEIIVEWQPKSHQLAWRDLDFKFIGQCNQLLLPGDETFEIKFRKSFAIQDGNIVADFIAVYFNQVWSIRPSNLIIKQS